jgi:hypothetical protein
MPQERKTISHGWLYVARVHRDDHTGLVTLTVGRDQDIFEVTEGAEFVTLVTPESLFDD